MPTSDVALTQNLQLQKQAQKLSTQNQKIKLILTEAFGIGDREMDGVDAETLVCRIKSRNNQKYLSCRLWIQLALQMTKIFKRKDLLFVRNFQENRWHPTPLKTEFSQILYGLYQIRSRTTQCSQSLPLIVRKYRVEFVSETRHHEHKLELRIGFAAMWLTNCSNIWMMTVLENVGYELKKEF